MGAMFSMVRGGDGRNGRDVLRAAVGRGVNDALQSGRRLPFGGAPARAVARALQPSTQPTTQPVRPEQPQARTEPSLGAMFSPSQTRPNYGNGRQMQKGWWP